MSGMIGSEAIAFIGGGNMTRSLIGGLVARGVPSERISVSEPQEVLRDALAMDFGVRVFADNADAVDAAPLVLLAVKPQMMRAVCERLAGHVDDALVVSIAAGITCRQLQHWLGASRGIVRCMPNTPALIGVGAIGLYAKPTTSDESRDAVERALSAAGVCVWVPEEAQMDAVTALSGSGPAYAFLLAEAMQQAAVQLGLSQEVAGILTRQTLLGAARMLDESGEPAAELRQRVTSPGGTTHAALSSFERDGFPVIVERALEAAWSRSVELSSELDG